MRDRGRGGGGGRAKGAESRLRRRDLWFREIQLILTGLDISMCNLTNTAAQERREVPADDLLPTPVVCRWTLTRNKCHESIKLVLTESTNGAKWSERGNASEALQICWCARAQKWRGSVTAWLQYLNYNMTHLGSYIAQCVLCRVSQISPHSQKAKNLWGRVELAQCLCSHWNS